MDYWSLTTPRKPGTRRRRPRIEAERGWCAITAPSPHRDLRGSGSFDAGRTGHWAFVLGGRPIARFGGILGRAGAGTGGCLEEAMIVKGRGGWMELVEDPLENETSQESGVARVGPLRIVPALCPLDPLRRGHARGSRGRGLGHARPPRQRYGPPGTRESHAVGTPASPGARPWHAVRLAVRKTLEPSVACAGGFRMPGSPPRALADASRAAQAWECSWFLPMNERRGSVFFCSILSECVGRGGPRRIDDVDVRPTWKVPIGVWAFVP